LFNIVRKFTQHEQINFLLTNRIPRKALTQWMGWYSGIQSPWLTKLNIFIWRFFANDLDLSEAKKQSFPSLQACFTRELKDGARPLDMREEVVMSPCDAIVGQFGDIEGSTVYQAKGFPYELSELIPDADLQAKYRNGKYIPLRLTSSMYHRFHAPVACEIKEINYISGDTWNVNPVALKRVEKLYCRNERAVVDLKLSDATRHITLVPVAAVLVASMRFLCLDFDLNLQYRGENHLPCDASYQKGDEMGYFQHGSTIILFASANFVFHESISIGHRIKMGEPLMFAV